MRSGSVLEPDLAPCEEVYVDNTSWKLIELGEVTIPSMGYRDPYNTADLARYFTIAIDAERLSGSGSLDMDCLLFIPCEHFIHASHTDNTNNLSLRAYTLEDDTVQITLGAGTQVYTNAEVMSRGFYLPTDLGFAIMAGQTTTAHDLTKTFEFEMFWYPRWPLFRGS